ncbi:MAG: superfamily protein, partial [Bryobacterales bacterium]|nr:superfamily protein [Bryobacterales bacterium]
PALALALVLWRVRRKNYVGYSLLSYLGARVRRLPYQIVLPRLCDSAGLLALSAALLNPVTPLAERTVQSQGLNMALVVDLSSSMEMPVTGGKKSAAGREETRLDAVKSAIVDFIRLRKSDRIGVVVFSNNAYVVTPLTLDYAYLENYVQMINDRTLSDEGMTAIGEGLLTARDMLVRQAEAGHRRGNVIVLLTDGENNTGRPVDVALREVRMAGIKTYFIGVEVVMGTTVENQGFNDAPSLLAGVVSTGGKYFDVRNAGQLRQAYEEIAGLEKAKFRTREKLHDIPAFAPFAAAALFAFACGQILRWIPHLRELS